MIKTQATLVGTGAILLWALLALFTAGAGGVPPFQLTAMCFAIGGCAGLLYGFWRGGLRAALLGQPPGGWLIGIGGLFGYHLMYFIALQSAPVAEASLIAYLWPLLIVLFSAILPSERLRWPHILGAALGLLGTAMLVLKDTHFAEGAQTGYLAALACAFIWSGYSVLTRRFEAVPTLTVAGYCLGVAALSAACHLVFEAGSVWPQSMQSWLSVLGLGLGPVGAAFYIWDYGVKRGDIQLLGVLAYAAPLLSTIILVLAGFAEPTWGLGLACLLIVGGSALAGILGRSGKARQRS